MWPFGGSKKQQVPEDEQERARRRLLAERRAYANCVKANSSDTSACNNLEHRLLERWAEMVDLCQNSATEYQDCYACALVREDYPPIADFCSAEIKKMKECLQVRDHTNMACSIRSLCMHQQTNHIQQLQASLALNRLRPPFAP